MARTPFNALMRGLSLLELVVSILIMALLLFSVFQILTSGTTYQMRSRSSSKLAALMQKVMEQARLVALTFDDSLPPPLPDTDWQFFSGSDEVYRYRINYYTYQVMTFPQPDGTGECPARRKYIVAVQVAIEGPVNPDGSAKYGYSKVSSASLVAADKYMGETAIAPAMPAELHPAPPTPMIHIAMPPTPNTGAP
ncbi:MAG: hypothetical protein RDV48_12985 [Candidatus Eremiobacteraeota bacterium]|nr:hypothetical protein [Candidatus Eremiobacteraeota bacterium]